MAAHFCALHQIYGNCHYCEMQQEQTPHELAMTQRRLDDARAQHYRSSASTNGGRGSTAHEESASQRKRIAVACGRCRKRKIRCSGDNGTGSPCTNCKSAGWTPCQFLRVASTFTPYREHTSPRENGFHYSVEDSRQYQSRGSGTMLPTAPPSPYAHPGPSNSYSAASTNGAAARAGPASAYGNPNASRNGVVSWSSGQNRDDQAVPRPGQQPEATNGQQNGYHHATSVAMYRPTQLVEAPYASYPPPPSTMGYRPGLAYPLNGPDGFTPVNMDHGATVAPPPIPMNRNSVPVLSAPPPPRRALPNAQPSHTPSLIGNITDAQATVAVGSESPEPTTEAHTPPSSLTEEDSPRQRHYALSSVPTQAELDHALPNGDGPRHGHGASHSVLQFPPLWSPPSQRQVHFPSLPHHGPEASYTAIEDEPCDDDSQVAPRVLQHPFATHNGHHHLHHQPRVVLPYDGRHHEPYHHMQPIHHMHISLQNSPPANSMASTSMTQGAGSDPYVYVDMSADAAALVMQQGPTPTTSGAEGSARGSTTAPTSLNSTVRDEPSQHPDTHESDGRE